MKEMNVKSATPSKPAYHVLEEAALIALGEINRARKDADTAWAVAYRKRARLERTIAKARAELAKIVLIEQRLEADCERVFAYAATTIEFRTRRDPDWHTLDQLHAVWQACDLLGAPRAGVRS